MLDFLVVEAVASEAVSRPKTCRYPENTEFLRFEGFSRAPKDDNCTTFSRLDREFPQEGTQKSERREQAALKERIKNETRVRYGYRRIHVLLRREG